MPGGRYFSVNKYWEVIFKGVYIYGDTGVTVHIDSLK